MDRFFWHTPGACAGSGCDNDPSGLSDGDDANQNPPLRLSRDHPWPGSIMAGGKFLRPNSSKQNEVSDAKRGHIEHARFVLSLSDPLKGCMAELSFVCPGAILHLRNKQSLGEDGAFPPQDYCR